MVLRNRSELKSLQEAGHITEKVLTALQRIAQPGVSTLELEQQANRLLAQYRSIAPFKSYTDSDARKFNQAVCVSLNDEIVNGPPSRERFLKSGDLVSIATAAEQRGIHAKAARTFYIGDSPPPDVQRLLNETAQAISRVVAASRQQPQNCMLNEVLKQVPLAAQEAGLTILEGLGGACIGKKLHEEPYIPNTPEALSETIPLVPGFAFVLMPMFSLGADTEHTVHADNWTYLTKDGALSAHFADTLLMTDEGLINITKSV